MMPRLFSFLRSAAVLCLLLPCATAIAAQVTAQSRGAYQRLMFSFDQPAHLNINKGGSTLTLHFDAPLNTSSGALQGMLKGYATRVAVSANGRDVTLTMAKPYRIRQFRSGDTVGVDIIGMPDAKAQATPAPAPDSSMLTTKREVASAGNKPESLGEIPAPVKKAPPLKAVPKKEKPVPAKARPETLTVQPAAPAKAPAPEPMLTTKKTPVEPSAPTAAAPMLSSKREAAPVVPSPVPVVPEVSKAPMKAALPAPAPEKAGPFIVSLNKKSDATTLNFPFRTRTAAAVFERDHMIWIIFSQPERINTELLRSVLPKTVTDIVQYGGTGHTVLRLTTDGSLHANAAPVKGHYGWDVTLAPVGLVASIDTPISADSNGDMSSLRLEAFDVAPPFKFYDPTVGDLILVAPTFEAGRGVVTGRHFPELDILATNQGIVVASAREDVEARATRLGVILEAPNGLAITKNLVQNVHAGLTSSANGILLPYDQWYVPPAKFADVLSDRLQALSVASKEGRGDALLSLATLYLGQGMGSEALGYLELIQAEMPDFYKTRKLALLTTAAHTLEHHPMDAAASLAAPELAELKEADLWREYLDLFTARPNAVQQAVANASAPAVASVGYSVSDDSEDPAKESPSANAFMQPTKPLMHFLKYNKSFIRFYPPRIRQRLVVAAADAYIENGLEEKALAAFDTLNRDDILEPVKRHAEYALALVDLKAKKTKDAEKILDRLENQGDDPEIRARARYTHVMLQFNSGVKTAEETYDALQTIRTGWRGDALERSILKSMARIAEDSKQYDNALRSLRTYTEEFPGDSDYLSVAGQMGDLFEQLYMNGLADQMPPLKALSLFYEFRDLTPIGDKGDVIIQKLADRLAAFDLLDRAAQLLENQISYRLSGQTRSQVGARLALLYILNHQPKEALRVLDVSNFGANSPELQRQRLELAAQALNDDHRHEDALNAIYNDHTPQGELLKLDILWSAQDWPNMVNQAEDILSKRADLTAKLTPTETDVLLKLALGYSFEGDYNQLRYLKDYYGQLLPDTGYKQIFDFITNDTAPLDREDSSMLAEQINRTESFLGTFKAKIAAGKLSEAVK